MEIVVLLIAIYVLSKFENVNNKTEFNILVGCIMGSVFLVFWPYIYYVSQILLWDNEYAYTLYIALLIVTMIFIVLLSKFHISIYAPILAVILFVSMWFFSYAFEVQVKNKLADFFGYFDSEFMTTKKLSGVEYREYKIIKGGYTISLPTEWQQHKLKKFGFTYFKNEWDQGGALEFRPKCFLPVKLSMSDMVENLALNIADNTHLTKSCYRWHKDGYACKVKIGHFSSDKLINDRVRWFGIKNNTGHAIELDFVLQNENSEITKSVDSVINTIRVNKLDKSPSNCVSVVEWF